jgi:hypothetical protein
MWLRFLTFPLALIGGLIAAVVCLIGLVVALAYPITSPRFPCGSIR